MIYPKNPLLLPLALYQVDGTMAPDYFAMLQHCRDIQKRTGVNYQVSELRAELTGEGTRLFIIRPVDNFAPDYKGFADAYELFIFGAFLIGDDDIEPRQTIIQWFWHAKAHTLFGYTDKGNCYCQEDWYQMIDDLTKA